MSDPDDLTKIIRAKAIAAACIELAKHNIPLDIQELLIMGDPQRDIRPGAMERAIISAMTSFISTALAHEKAKALIQ